MKSKLERAVDYHQCMASIHPKPKPVKQAKEKREPIAKRRRILEKQIEAIVKLIIAWRDGQVCVMGNLDGSRCGNGLMWNHYIAQVQSPWMRHDLGNVFWGCGNHNLLDKHGDPILGIWVQKTFGSVAVISLRNEAKSHVGKKRTEFELEKLLAHYDELYQNRYYVELTLEGLVRGGYYGEIIKSNF